ncbi:MAG: hypothetical protein XE04_1374 [Marinimicrobia bacterium 46_43]|nr:MAG: hypothetical protein XE04_1374 [Marinimicrobia bacterium 46_43]
MSHAGYPIGPGTFFRFTCDEERAALFRIFSPEVLPLFLWIKFTPYQT